MTLSAGVVVSQAISIFTMPIISRVYSPEIIGDCSVITSYSSIIGILVTLGLMPAIMLPAKDDESKGICRLLALSICGITSVLCIIAVICSKSWKLFDVSISYWTACLILWVLVILSNLSSVGYAYLNRQKLYKVLFWNPTIGTASNAIVSIGLGLLGCGLWGYMCGNLISALLILLHMLRYANPYFGHISREYTFTKLIKKYNDFPLVLLPSNFCGTLAQQIPIQMVSKFWGNFVLGSYSMCLSILGLPSKFLAGPVNRVFYREASERTIRGEQIGDFTFRLLKANVKIAIIPIIILIIFGPQLFVFVLGDKWETAGTFASVLGIYQAMAFCNSCLAGKFIVINRKPTILLLNILAVILYGSCFLFCHTLSLDAMATITIYAIVAALFELCDTFVFMIQAKVNIISYFKFIGLYLAVPVTIATMIRVFVLN